MTTVTRQDTSAGEHVWVHRNCLRCGQTCDDKDGNAVYFDWNDPAVRRQTFQCYSCMTMLPIPTE